MRKVLQFLLPFLVALGTQSAYAATTKARLVLSHTSARPGETIWAGVHLKMAPQWHTYWENGGEPGSAPRIDWSLPNGITAGEILWPIPEKLTAAGQVTYVYADEVVLLVPLVITSETAIGPLGLKARVAWIECEKLCVVGSSKVEAALSIGDNSASSPDAPLLDLWKKKLPQPKPASFARARWEKESTGDSRPLLLEWPSTAPAKELDFYPYTSTNGAVHTVTETVPAAPGKNQVRKMVEKGERGWPREVAGLLIERGDAGALIAAYDVKVSIAEAGSSTASVGNPAAVPAQEKSLLAWVGLAFLGGLILNLMPCVLPVIALKIFGFVNQAREAPARVRRLGLVYGLGVLFSFAILAGLVIGVQRAGHLASWGMQFGNPYFLVAMTVLITLVALNLFGLFEVTLGGGSLGTAAELAGREGASGAFFNGVLATVLATPCTAPFLAGALGFAFAQPPAVILIMFLAVGVGLASPYVVLSFQPAWLKFIPKPGAWMEKFKIAMGFPMLATALWLLTLTGGHYGSGGVLWVGIFLVFVALAAWVWGEFVQRGTRRRGLAMVLSLLFLASGYGLALENQLHWRTPPKLVAGQVQNDPGGIQWLPWSTAAVAAARAEGRVVFVDFTADWCVTCQANKKTSIEIDAVRSKLREINAVPLLGDYTRVPDDITEELKRFGRAGVPLVLVYPRNAAREAEVLPALLTPSIVLDALSRAAQ